MLFGFVLCCVVLCWSYCPSQRRCRGRTTLQKIYQDCCTGSRYVPTKARNSLNTRLRPKLDTFRFGLTLCARKKSEHCLIVYRFSSISRPYRDHGIAIFFPNSWPSTAIGHASLRRETWFKRVVCCDYSYINMVLYLLPFPVFFFYLYWFLCVPCACVRACRRWTGRTPTVTAETISSRIFAEISSPPSTRTRGGARSVSLANVKKCLFLAREKHSTLHESVFLLMTGRKLINGRA